MLQQLAFLTKWQRDQNSAETLENISVSKLKIYLRISSWDRNASHYKKHDYMKDKLKYCVFLKAKRHFTGKSRNMFKEHKCDCM